MITCTDCGVTVPQKKARGGRCMHCWLRQRDEESRDFFERRRSNSV